MFCIILARYRYIALILLAGIIVPITITATQVATKLEDQISAVKVGRYLAKHHTNNSVYLYQDFEKISAIGFYSGRCFKMVDSHSNDLYYAQHLPAYQDWFLSQEAFAHNKAYKVLVINKSNLADIIPIQSQFNFHVLKNLGDWWVIAAKH